MLLLSGSVDIARLLLAKGVNVNVLNGEGGYAALFYAACSGHLDMIRFLAENGADVNIVDKVGRTAYWVAVSNQASAATALLRQLGAL